MAPVGSSTDDVHGFKAGAAITKYRFVKLSAEQTVVATATGTDNSIGVSVETVTTAEQARGKGVPVAYDGIALMEAGAAVSVGDLIASDSSGRAIKAVSTRVVCGIAWTPASGAGDQIMVQLNLPGGVLA